MTESHRTRTRNRAHSSNVVPLAKVNHLRAVQIAAGRALTLSEARNGGMKMAKTKAIVDRKELGDLDAFRIAKDDFDTLLKERAAAMSTELDKRVIKRPVDELGQASKAHDFDEETVAFEEIVAFESGHGVAVLAVLGR